MPTRKEAALGIFAGIVIALFTLEASDKGSTPTSEMDNLRNEMGATDTTETTGTLDNKITHTIDIETTSEISEPTPTPDNKKPKVNQVSQSKKSGILSINANPWAQVWVDGAPRGYTPMELKLPAGRHDIILRYDGIESKKTVIIQTEKIELLNHDW